MTAPELRRRVLSLIEGWLRNEKVRADETSVLALNALAGDIEMIDLTETDSQSSETRDIVK